MIPENEILAIAIGERMRTMREEAGLTVREVARRMGSHGPIVSRFEAGRHMQSIDVVKRYARAVRCAPVDLIRVLDGVQDIFGGH